MVKSFLTYLWICSGENKILTLHDSPFNDLILTLHESLFNDLLHDYDFM